MKKKIIRSSTIGLSLDTFCRGLLSEMKDKGYEVVALSSPDKELKSLGEREHVRTIGVPMERHISLLKDIVSLCNLIRVFKKEQPDMVHSMTPKAGLLCMIAAWIVNVPVRIHTFTGLVWPTSKGLSRKILMTTDRLTCACATHVIPEGQGVLDDLLNHNITHKPLKVLGYGNIRGIDMSYWSRRAEVLKKSALLRVPDCFTFIFVGRIVGDKGVNELVSAFMQILDLKALGKSRLILVGPFEDKLDPVSVETRQQINTLEEIVCVGPQYGDDLLAWYAASDCFVFPSYREGFPNTVIEAGAMGLPSIVTDINGAREIITNGNGKESHLKPGEHMSIRKNGIVIPSKDDTALYRAMRWMMEYPFEQERMSNAARPLVEARYEQGFVREQLYNYYKIVLGE